MTPASSTICGSLNRLRSSRRGHRRPARARVMASAKRRAISRRREGEAVDVVEALERLLADSRCSPSSVGGESIVAGVQPRHPTASISLRMIGTVPAPSRRDSAPAGSPRSPAGARWCGTCSGCCRARLELDEGVADLGRHFIGRRASKPSHLKPPCIERSTTEALARLEATEDRAVPSAVSIGPSPISVSSPPSTG